jgi:hypothetical protein
MPTERELAESHGKLAGSTKIELDVPDVLPPLDVPRAIEFADRNIRPLYETALLVPGAEKPSGVAAAEKPAAVRVVAYFAARCLGRVLGVPDPARAIDRAKAVEARAVLTDLLKKAVAVCAEEPQHPDQRLAAEVAAFRVPRALMGRSRERSALTEVLEGAGVLGDCLRSVYRGRADDCRRCAVDTALHALNALVLESGVPFERSEDAKSLHSEQLRDLEIVARLRPATQIGLGDTGPFGPLWKAEAPDFLAEGKLAWQGEILAELTPPMPAKSTVLVSAECSHAPPDVYAELQMPKGKGSRADEPQLSSRAQERLLGSVVADLRDLGASCARLQEQMVALVQERLDVLAGRTFGSFAANKKVVDELNALVEGHGIRLLYDGPKKEYRGRVVLVRVYDHPDATAGQFFVRLTEAGAKKVSAENEFPALKAAAGNSSQEQV